MLLNRLVNLPQVQNAVPTEKNQQETRTSRRFSVMFGLILLLVVTGSSAQLLTPGGLYPPSYVEARDAFAQARLFLQENLPHETRDFTNPEVRKHFAFGIMAGVTAALVKAFDSVTVEYKPLTVLQKAVPKTWENYNEISRNINNILAEAAARIKPLTSAMDKLCDTTESAEVCNLQVHEHVINHRFLKLRAKLLLQLGTVSKILNRHAKLLEDVAAANSAVPYLFQLVDTTAFEVFIAELTRAYELMQPKVRLARRYKHPHF